MRVTTVVDPRHLRGGFWYYSLTIEGVWGLTPRPWGGYQAFGMALHVGGWTPRPWVDLLLSVKRWFLSVGPLILLSG